MESLRLAKFSKAVRDSTQKRLNTVPPGFENWKISRNAMSFSDVALHLIECDKWLFQKMKHDDLQPITGKAGSIIVKDRFEYQSLLNELELMGQNRYRLINDLKEDEYNRIIFDSRFDGNVTVWWIIVRGNLDHEIHHRGQLVAYHRVLLDKK